MKITFTGPESSGKTSVSKAIAAHFDAIWFPETARSYLLERKGKYHFSDIENIALHQEQQRQAKLDKSMGVYDTENIVLYIWSMFKYNKCAAKVKSLMENQVFDHYFLCSPEGIPWEEDPLRESPNQREELFELYLEQLQKLQVDFTVLNGSFQERVEVVIRTIKGLQ